LPSTSELETAPKLSHVDFSFSQSVPFYKALDIGVGAGKLLGVRRILPTFPQTCPKNTPKITSKKDDCTLIVGAFFSNQRISSTIFAQISPKLAQISPNHLKKKRLHFHSGRHFLKIKAHQAILRRFSHILPKFPHILHGF